VHSPPQLYLDTSVIGGYFDAEFQEETRKLWCQRDSGFWEFVTSVLVAEELEPAPPKVRELFAKTFAVNGKRLESSLAVVSLAEAYLAAGVLSEKFRDDARHVALCSYHHLDYLVSWNFKHLANARRSSGFNEVNALQGFPAIRIVSPNELIHEHPSEKRV
jgi:predicted nucleic acid-binding protein